MISGAYRFPRQDMVIYGQSAHEAVGELARRYGASRLFLLTTRSLSGPDGQATRLAREIGPACVGVFDAIASHSPRNDVIAGAAAARAAGADLLIAFGGGSVIDAAKLMQVCLWAGLTEPGELAPYRLGRGPDRRDLREITPGVRMIAIPTTLSAAEFTATAGVRDTQSRVKEAYSHPDMAPLGVILDPVLQLATPLRLWFSTGLKAVDHAVEQLCNPERMPLSDALAAEGLRLLAEGLARTREDPADIPARARCQHGMWLAISGAASGRGMGASHAIGHTLGGSYDIAHGITSCITLHAVLAWNQSASRDQQALVSRLMGRGALPAADAVRDLVLSLGLPSRLSEVMLGRSHFRAIANHTMHDRAIRSNPRPVTGAEDILEILELCA